MFVMFLRQKFECLDEQQVFALEMEVDGSMRQTRAFGHGLKSRVGESALGNGIDCRVDQLAAPFLPGRGPSALAHARDAFCFEFPQ